MREIISKNEKTAWANDMQKKKFKFWQSKKHISDTQALFRLKPVTKKKNIMLISRVQMNIAIMEMELYVKKD